MNEDLTEILQKLEDILEKAHKDYVELNHASAFEREKHGHELQELYTDIKDQFDNQYSIDYVQKLEEENEDLKFDLQDKDDIIENIRNNYDDLKEEFEDFKERVRELCS
jgi:predicted RNase H-like nuclease (RuvC/YqgF family)